MDACVERLKMWKGVIGIGFASLNKLSFAYYSYQATEAFAKTV